MIFINVTHHVCRGASFLHWHQEVSVQAHTHTHFLIMHADFCSCSDIFWARARLWWSAQLGSRLLAKHRNMTLSLRFLFLAAVWPVSVMKVRNGFDTQRNDSFLKFCDFRKRDEDKSESKQPNCGLLQMNYIAVYVCVRLFCSLYGNF